MMYELTIEQVFSAAHAIVMNGVREPLHGHDWRVRVTVGGETLDSDGLLCDFHLLEKSLSEIVGGWNNRNFNEVSPFDRINPTAELVARHIADQMSARLPQGVTLRRVSVTEAPGCEAAVII